MKKYGRFLFESDAVCDFTHPLGQAQQERERQLLLQQQPTSPPQGDVSITIGGNAANPLNLTAEQRIDRSMANSNAYVDSYLQMGEAALDKLKKQGWILKVPFGYSARHDT